MSQIFPISVKDKYSYHLIAFLKVLDGITTWNFLRLGFHEGNKLALFLIRHVGVWGNTLILTALSLAYVWGLRYVYDRFEYQGLRLSCEASYNTGVAISVIVLYWNLFNTYMGLQYRAIGLL